MADKTPYLLSLALGKDYADKTSKLPAAAPGSKEERLINQAKKRGTQNYGNRS